MFSQPLRVAAVLVLSASASFAQPAPEPAPFDGRWSVSIVTQQGRCDGMSSTVSIVEGEITAADASATISGDVGDDGTVQVAVSARQGKAKGTGRLSGNTGSGTWSGGPCTGVWTAQRN